MKIGYAIWGITLLAATIAQASRLDDLIEPPDYQEALNQEERRQEEPSDPKPVTPKKSVADVEVPVASDVEYSLSSEQLEADICDFLRKRYHLEGELAIYPLTPLQDLVLSDAEYELVFTSLPASQLNSQISVRFQIECGGRIVARYATAMRVEHWEPAYVARSTLDRRHPLSLGDVAIVPVDTLRERLPLMSTDEPINLYEVVNRITAGEPILAKQLTLRPQIRRGELVEVSADEGALSVSLKAIALEDGNTGDFIRMRNPLSRKEFQAQITNENSVRVFF